jgi:hypothetical protein
MPGHGWEPLGELRREAKSLIMRREALALV